MNFTSMLFLWRFLPFVLLIELLLPRRLKMAFLLFMSILFYAWGEPAHLAVIFISMVTNFAGAQLLAQAKQKGNRRLILLLLIFFNLLLLGRYKYLSFVSGLLVRFLKLPLSVPAQPLLPVGISFFTFSMLSYVVDVYRNETPASRKPFTFALYTFFFPKLIQGPIERYHHFTETLPTDRTNALHFAYGVRRFIYGLTKKLLFANTFAVIVDEVFALPTAEVSAGLGWYTALLYSLQIYYDFSGYSDMAIGIAAMLGFSLSENFNYPYLSETVGEFWRRWHISLSGWFKDYVYIPLGGNRKGILRTCLNVLIVFFCTGLWHGAGLSFVAWGLYYGLLVAAERLFLKKALDRLPKVFRIIYMLFITLTGWTLFRADSLTLALELLKRMFTLSAGTYIIHMYLTRKTVFLLILALFLAGPLQALCPGLRRHMRNRDSFLISEGIFLLLLLFYCTALCVGNVYTPFIYFRF